MPIYMDVHLVPGVTARKVAEAHSKDLLLQDAHACKCMTYWIDEKRESVFCLIEAPSRDAVVELHNKAHGLIPHRIMEVSTTVVESFLGRIFDPEEAEISGDGLKIFSDPSFRILMVTTTADPVLLKHAHGIENTTALHRRYHDLVRKTLAKSDGREVEQGGTDFIISFASPARAVQCAMEIQKAMSPEDARTLDLKISLHGGEPLEKSNQLFGDTIQMARNLCAIARYFQVALSSTVRELVEKDLLQSGRNFLSLPPQDEATLRALFEKLEENWQDAAFDVEEYCQAMAMSKSQLYRKTISLTGHSPNMLIREYRLEKARELMKRKYHNISQVTFDSGFTSPSYFTKCFKKKFGLLPVDYMELLQA